MKENMHTSYPPQKTNTYYVTLLILGLGCFFLALSIHPLLITLTYVFFCVWSLVGIKQALQSLALSTIIKFLNPAMYTFPPEVGVLGWLVVFSAGVRILPTFSLRQTEILWPLGWYLLAIVALTFVASTNITVSLMKIVSFTFVVATILTGCSQLSGPAKNELGIWLFCCSATIIVLSLPILFFHGIGYYGQGFRGILSQPQAFGIFLAPLTALLTSAGIFSDSSKSIEHQTQSDSEFSHDLSTSKEEKNPDTSQITLLNIYVLLGLILVTWTSVILSRARTGALAVVLGIAAGFLISLMPRFKTVQWANPRRAVGLFVVLTTVGVISMTFNLGLSESLRNFVFKYEEVSLEEAVSATRGKGVEAQWNNFLTEPLTGHGFGIYASSKTPSNIITFWGIPLSASTEKGFVPTSILEETGIIGTGFFIYFLVVLTKSVLKNRDIRWICVYFSCLFVNVGEAVFFSVGGIGLFFWLFIGLACASEKAHRIE